MMFGAGVRSFWSQGVELTPDGLLPVNAVLARDGTYALEVRAPKNDLGWWGVGLPIDRSWDPVDLGASCRCTFEAFADAAQGLAVKVKSKSGLYSPDSRVQLRAAGADWDAYSADLALPDGCGRDAEMLIVTGPAEGWTVLLRLVLLAT